MKVYIIILNYKGWEDTIHCLESVFKLDYREYQVLVLDNGSQNNSFGYVRKWASGEVVDGFSHLSPPIPFIEYNATELINDSKENNNYPLVLISSDQNLGFTGGNNLCLRYATKKEDFSFALLLNNDTIIDKMALKNLVNKALSYQNKKKKVGIIGGKVFYYDFPKRIQYAGGAKLNKWLAKTTPVGGYEVDNGKYDLEELELDYIVGACMLVSKDFIREVGFMSEDYFFYFDELDWTERGKKKGWKIGYSWKSVIYHKEGASAGATNLQKKSKSKFSDFYALRNRLKFTIKFYPYCLPTVYLALVIAIVNRIKRKQFDRVSMIIKIILNPNITYEEING